MSKHERLPNQYTKLKSDSNPGYKIKNHLKQIYKFDQHFLSRIDEDLKLEGLFRTTMYESSINYLLRRLVTAAHYVHRINEIYGDVRIRSELRKYLKEHTRFEDETLNRLVAWLLQSIKNSRDDFNQSDKKKVLQQIEQFSWGCYMCGREMDFSETAEAYKLGTADHWWPRLFGGESELHNLRYTCGDCNGKYKKDFLDYSDYHFEEIAMVIESFSEYDKKAKNRSYESAIFAKAGYICAECHQPAYKVGELHIGRIDISDNFHFFNLTAYCQEHKPE